MFAIAALVKQRSGEVSFHDGILVSLPPELRDAQRQRLYSRINQVGWGTSELGYHYFAFEIDRNDFIIFPGLIIEGATKVTKKFYGYSITYTKAQIEALASGFAASLAKATRIAQEEQNLLVHDLRALSTAIYNSAIEADRSLQQGDYHNSRVRIENVIASQGMLKMRTDALDFAGNTLALGRDADIAIFRKVDKVVRCFMSLAASQEKSISLGGASFRRTRGAEVLELIPYGLIDNAIKYSPRRSAIEVQVQDTDATAISITSFGPKISDDELSQVFDKGFRGVAARATRVPGSGIGLHLVHRIVTEIFSGKINVSQAPTSLTVEGFTYLRTTFEVILPSFP